tara:strand:- start:107 stop:1120 length:1014 start_codon:yes stop_codon:yes gene_type:complete
MIFSDTYTFHKRYSLTTQTELDEYSEMPWLYTPLVDPQYNPSTISTVTKQNLNKVFNWQYTLKSRDVIKNEYKVLGIIHTNQNAIKSYVTRFDLSYDVLRTEKPHYIKGTNTSNINGVWEQVENVISPNDGSRLVGMTHDQYGTATGITVLAPTYDLSSFNSSLLLELNEYSTRNKMHVGGRLTICPDKVIFDMDLKYPKIISGMRKYEKRDFKLMSGEEMFMKKFKPSYYQGVNRHIFGFKRYNLLTLEQCEYILKDIYQTVGHISADFKINLQYVFSSDGTLTDIICSRLCYNQFEHCEEVRTFGYTAEEGGTSVDRRETPIVYTEYTETGKSYK